MIRGGAEVRQLSGVDATFLWSETPTSFGHVNFFGVYERPDDEFDAFGALRAQLIDRLGVLEPLRRRLVEVPLGLDLPYWVLDPDFDVDFHVRHIVIPAPGSPQQVAEQISRIIGRPMDRCRPLWEMYVLEGFEDEGFGILGKFHHSALDGGAAVEFAGIMHNLTPEDLAEPEALPDWPTEELPTEAEMLRLTVGELLRTPGKVLRLQVRGLRALADVTRTEGPNKLADVVSRELPGDLGRRVRRWMHRRDDDPEALIDRPAPLPTSAAPRTPFNGSITPHRRCAFRSVPFDDIKTIKRTHDCTINDVVMAVCAGGLRRYLLRHEALPEEPLVAGVPVSIRTGEESDPWTNRISSIFTTIPTNVADPLERIAAVNEAMTDAKEQFGLLPTDLLVDAAGAIPYGLANQAVRLTAQVHLTDRVTLPLNLIISNVAGPRQPLYMGTAQLRNYYPVSTITHGLGLNMTVMSYCDSLDLGFVTDRELMPDVWDLMQDCVDEIDGLMSRC